MKRRFSKVRLYTGGRVLHIVKCKPATKEKKKYDYFVDKYVKYSEIKKILFVFFYRKQKNKEKKFEMRWALPEDFMELSVMPRMLLDHFPENLEEALEVLIKQQEELPVMLWFRNGASSFNFYRYSHDAIFRDRTRYFFIRKYLYIKSFYNLTEILEVLLAMTVTCHFYRSNAIEL